MIHPQSKTDGLSIQNVDGELIVHDQERDEVHCLHPITAAVWDACDGATSVADITSALKAKFDGGTDDEVDEETVLSALDCLADADLLLQRIAPPSGVQRYSRRDLIRRLTATGAALAVSSILLPTPAQAQSGGGQSEGAAKQSEMSQKTQGEESQKEQATKGGGEQGQKEQQGKGGGEQSQKEQSSKGGSEQTQKEQQAKVGGEQSQKEQQAKGGGEQGQKEQGKGGGEQSQKEQASKGGEQATKQQAEQSAKQQAEQSAKQQAEQSAKNVD